MEQECLGPSPESEAQAPFFPGETQGLCCAHVLSPPGLLLLCEAVCTGVLTDPYGPVCQLPGNGLQAQLVLLGVRACFGGGNNLWDIVGISGVASSGEHCSLLKKKQNGTEPSTARCPP